MIIILVINSIKREFIEKILKKIKKILEININGLESSWNPNFIIFSIYIKNQERYLMGLWSLFNKYVTY